jgi:hypothetical protein
MSRRNACFVPSDARKTGGHFLGIPASSALIWVAVSQKISFTFSLNQPDHPHLRHQGKSSRRTTLASGVAAPTNRVWEHRGRQREEIDGETCLKSSL